MNQTYIRDVSKHVGEEIHLKGWLYNMRSSGKLMFPQIRDGSGIIQGVVFKKSVPEQVWNDCEKLTQESSIIVTGKVRADERAPGGYELDVTGVEVLQIAHDYPITPKEHGVEFLMDNRHLWLRSKRQHAILSIRAEVIRAVRDFFDSNGFLLMDTPIFTPAACEGTTTLFEVDYFEDAKAYLTQSGQLYNEATAAAFGKVYCFGPTFPRLQYDDAVRMLQEAHEKGEIEQRFEWGGDFGSPDETLISSQFDRPVMVHRYP